MLYDVTALQIDSQDETELTVCIAYGAAAAAAPDVVAATNTRLFTLLMTGDGSWQVTQMGGSDSCSLG